MARGIVFSACVTGGLGILLAAMPGDSPVFKVFMAISAGITALLGWLQREQPAEVGRIQAHAASIANLNRCSVSFHAA